MHSTKFLPLLLSRIVSDFKSLLHRLFGDGQIKLEFDLSLCWQFLYNSVCTQKEIKESSCSVLCGYGSNSSAERFCLESGSSEPVSTVKKQLSDSYTSQSLSV